jgi:hypothetical protein
LNTFFWEVEASVILHLNRIVDDFYAALEGFLVEMLEKENPDVLGLSVYEGTLPASLYAARLAKEKKPSLQTLMGGGIYAEQLSLGSPNWEFFLDKVPYIDKFIIGEGEQLFLKFLQHRLPGNQRIYTLKDINGAILDLSRVGLPDFSDFPLERYPYLAAYGSRSCPYRCNFCSETVQWGKYRKKNPRQIASELQALYHRYGAQLFLMCDSLLNPLVTDLAHELSQLNCSIYWDGYLRVHPEVCDPEKTLFWRRGGLYRTRLGVESGSQHVLDLMGKGITRRQIKEAIRSLAFAGIKTTTYWVVGYPGETEADFLQTLALLEELKNDIYEAWCSPFYYYPTGQVNSGHWVEKAHPLYPPEAKEMLIFQTWEPGGEPSRQETWQRMNRFVQYCKTLGIPNPYALDDIHKADRRWKTFHPNAAPSLVDFGNLASGIDERKQVKPLLYACAKHQDDGNFDFKD